MKPTHKKYKPKLVWELAQAYFKRMTCKECGGLLISPGMNDPVSGRWRAGAGYTCSNCGLVAGKVMQPSVARDPSFQYKNQGESYRRKTLRETLMNRKRVYTEIYNKNSKTARIYPDAHFLLKQFCEKNKVEMMDVLSELIIEILGDKNG